MRSDSIDSKSSSSSDIINGGEKFNTIFKRQLKKHMMKAKMAEKSFEKPPSMVIKEE